MKRNCLIVTALLALGLGSSARATLHGHPVAPVNGGYYYTVYITGSTAFRANLFAALTNTTAAPTVFDAGTVPVLQPSTADAGTSDYNIFGLIGGISYVISVDLTGSEAGMASLVGDTITYQVPTDSVLGLGSGVVGNTAVQLAGTPSPITYIDPTSGAAATPDITATPDIAFADTSFAVSLSTGLAAKPIEYGTVGCVTFTWAKGTNSVADSSYTDLTNVSIPQLQSEIYGAQPAHYFTGNPADTDNVYLVGRNKGSGTRVNTLCDLGVALTPAVTQYAVNNCTYVNSNNGRVLTVGAIAPFSSGSTAKNGTGVHLLTVGNDGFDAGSGVAKTLGCDVQAGTYTNITIGYVGISDGKTVLAEGGKWLTLDGVAENDENVIEGTYSFWGHEHVYVNPNDSTSSPAGVVAGLLVGSQAPATANTQFLDFAAVNSALEAHGGLANVVSANSSTGIDAATMAADKPSGGDYGYPAQY